MSLPAPTIASPALQTERRPYPLRMVGMAMIITVCMLLLGSTIIDSVWGNYHEAEEAAFRGVCYWVGDARTLTRIALYGYTDYVYDLSDRHLTNLPDRSWWPVFPLLTAGMIALSGDGACSGWTVNLIAVVLLVPVIQAITGTRRLSLLIGLMIVPFAMWLYVGMAEGTFLLFSGLLWWVCLQWRPDQRRRNLRAGAGALLLGILVGLTKPNSIALLPAFLTLTVGKAWSIWHTAEPETLTPHRAHWRALLSDASPIWPGLLAATGIALGNGLWFYQTSGYYPFYILLAQRTLWFKQFYPGDLPTLLEYLSGGFRQLLGGTLDTLGLERLMRLSAPLMIGILAAQGLPPRWPGLAARRVPGYARFSLLAILGVMFYSGQAHAITRYAMGNIFFVVLYLQYVYGNEDEPPLWRLPGIVLRRRPGAVTALLRLTVLLFGPLLTITVLSIGPRLGI